ncbi:hypothetical protein SODALDRAFT_353932 [Sodiomyces alkalinus F11]|uniref:Uncharacterized protein n=1 Tax=Sodiomyces alkalinus (strain CBS 110278 / VKM F-3762 / F11) TaxID=1314773 RepID=A0A3N2Q542_SODAK|nr:hypothetical protein SODALDRAFT_353932 [Sodiomyces alkalinus F11]ROT41817.1 hypothetical protein SODALDRAFT_353932 [Sodiomyces alkalinus F11]
MYIDVLAPKTHVESSALPMRRLFRSASDSLVFWTFWGWLRYRKEILVVTESAGGYCPAFPILSHGTTHIGRLARTPGLGQQVGPGKDSASKVAQKSHVGDLATGATVTRMRMGLKNWPPPPTDAWYWDIYRIELGASGRMYIVPINIDSASLLVWQWKGKNEEERAQYTWGDDRWNLSSGAPIASLRALLILLK